MSTIHEEPRDLIGYGRRPPKVVWPNGAKVAVTIALNYEEGSEHREWAGDPTTDPLAEFNYSLDRSYRDFQFESVYEYGSRCGIWRLLRIFDEYDVKVSFFACGMALELNPEVGKAIQEAGHETCGHGYRWSEPWLMSEEDERREVEQAVAAIERTTGERPYGWYWRYSRTPVSREILQDLGFLYDADAYNDDLPYFVDVRGKGHLVIPYTVTYNDFRFVVADGCIADPGRFADFLKRGLDEYWHEGTNGYPRVMSVGIHPRLVGQAGRASAIREFIEHGLEKGDVWFARRGDIARWWIDHHHEFER